jgi:hypothetical protein
MTDPLSHPALPDIPPYPGAPRWVKIFGAVAAAILLLLVIVFAGGQHGPGGSMQHGPAAPDITSPTGAEEPMPHGGDQ